jgi:Holliday junction resolvasome RuvABC endonuclease subunit
MKIPVLGMDPSMRNWGLAKGMLDLDSGVLDLLQISIVKGEDLEGKQIRKNSSDVHLATELCRGVLPLAQWASVVFVEVPVGSQSAYGMKSYGIVCGVLGAMRHAGIEIIQVDALDVKECLTGNKNATKKQMIEAAVTEYPHVDWPRQEKNGAKFKKGDLKKESEHCADAIATIHAGVQTPAFQTLMRLFAKV